MSTRGTIKIDYTTFYCHYDSYPEGMAAYLRAMMKSAHSRGGLADRFLIANPIVELTESRELHGDLEYSYVLNSKTKNLLVFSKYWDCDDWVKLAEMPLLEFAELKDYDFELPSQSPYGDIETW